MALKNGCHFSFPFFLSVQLEMLRLKRIFCSFPRKSQDYLSYCGGLATAGSSLHSQVEWIHQRETRCQCASPSFSQRVCYNWPTSVPFLLRVASLQWRPVNNDFRLQFFSVKFLFANWQIDGLLISTHVLCAGLQVLSQQSCNKVHFSWYYLFFNNAKKILNCPRLPQEALKYCKSFSPPRLQILQEQHPSVDSLVYVSIKDRTKVPDVSDCLLGLMQNQLECPAPTGSPAQSGHRHGGVSGWCFLFK